MNFDHIPHPDADVVHYGVKGMRWGVRNDKRRSGTVSKRGRSKSVEKANQSRIDKKKVALVVGAAVGVAAIAGGAYYAKQHFGVKISDIPTPSDKTKDFVEKTLEPSSPIHASRTKNKGFKFFKDGSLDSPMSEYNKAGFANNTDPTMFKRYGDNNEKVALRFEDPLGRKDFAGRVIPHEVILPKTLADGVETLQQGIDKVWPSIKDSYGDLYDDLYG